YSDEAMSGANADRFDYRALLEAAKRKDFDVIVVDEVSRLWRDQEEQWRAVKTLRVLPNPHLRRE
ncbi:MAG: recombinase family protein, partial [Acidiferrobacterales bacterium]